MKYHCCDERRLSVVKQAAANPTSLNAIEYLEVHDSGVAGDPLRQRTLFLKLVKPAPPLTPENVRIEGGQRIKTIALDWVARADALPAGEDPALVADLASLDQIVVVRAAFYGDFSLYTLRLVTAGDDDTPLAGFDPRLSEISFSFKVLCETDFDCAAVVPCPPQARKAPPLDYRAKDYASFRRLMLDRINVLAPTWRERNPADLGVALVELIAYAGDYLSYRQDAVATEAYLGTARRRVSLRRHARLVDYQVHEGCNARTWLRVFVDGPSIALARGTQVLTRVPGVADRVAPGSPDHRAALAAGALVFETCDDAVLYQAHERLTFYAWGERRCCLPKGATRATLRGQWPNLKAGDVLIFAEERGPNTGDQGDADPLRRCAVRLSHVRFGEDPSGGLFETPPSSDPVPVTEIEWVKEDRVPFPLCLSAITDRDHGETYIAEVSAAYGNIVLCDHGRTLDEEPLGSVPQPRLRLVETASTLSCKRVEPREIPPRFRPSLKQAPLSHAVPQQPVRLFSADATPTLLADLAARSFSPAVRGWLQGEGIVFRRPPVVQGGDGQWSISDGEQFYGVRHIGAQLDLNAQAQSALASVQLAPHRARPQITLRSAFKGKMGRWEARPDLLASLADAPHFVVEAEHDGRVELRFGDDHHGRRPNSGEAFFARYRVGNGTAGNIGADSIAHVVSTDSGILRLSNPLPAAGGANPETGEDIKRDAPEAFKVQERAVTPADYAAVTERHAEVQRASATFRWTGSWHTVFLTVDRLAGASIDAPYKNELRRHVERYRMAGYDLEVDAPRFVPLELGLFVCVKPDYFCAHVRAALLQVLGNGWLANGQRAVFHPDNFSFGQPVYLSDLYAAAQNVEGVASVTITTFQRQREPSIKALDDGFIGLGRLEIAQLDNDPNFPERGVFTLQLGGGK